jgi:hypothetical protein
MGPVMEMLLKDLELSTADLQQMRQMGLTEAQVCRQIGCLLKPRPFIRLQRPCTLGDGIGKISPPEMEKYLQLQAQAAAGGRFCKFVPASGAASRMFQVLQQIYDSYGDNPEEISRRAANGEALAREFLQFLEALRLFPFYSDLAAVMARDGLSLDAVIEQGQFKILLQYLLTDRGLGYTSLPKGLLKFHCYPNGCRTSFEEHLCEAANYLGERGSTCLVHFSVSPEHEQRFKQLVQEIRPLYEKQFGVRYEIEFSCQTRNTDAMAVGADNKPFRDQNGRLLFRPGGHGALLQNLGDLKGDLVYIKNIDNVAPDHLQGPTFYWNKILGGYLVALQQDIHHWLRLLQDRSSEDLSREVEEFCRDRLFFTLPDAYQFKVAQDKWTYLLKKLRRPIRVCGMVPNTGEPGGGPFWVAGPDKTLSRQIVEKAQVDLSDPGQVAIWQAATYFNPVNLVCALRDEAGQPFDLRQYVDQDAFIISEKSKDGKVLRALELPGLWNGAMADWITVFMEVPGVTFSPVKTVTDFLRPEHQPGP